MNTVFEQYRLSPEIIRALDHLHYNAPTEVQQKVIPYLMNKSDLIV